MHNARGQVTVDFIFAMVLVLGFTGLLFVVTFSLSVAAITQYITFAAARNAMAAHLDMTQQTQRGHDKYQELISNPVFKPLYSNGWFSVDADVTITDHTTVFPDYVAAAAGTNDFWGAGTNFVARILDFLSRARAFRRRVHSVHSRSMACHPHTFKLRRSRLIQYGNDGF